MKPMIKNKIVVIGGNHHNGLGIIRSLGEYGCRVSLIVVGEGKSFVTKSRYLEKRWIVNNETKVLSILLNEFNDKENKTIILPADDYSASLIDKNINKLKDSFIFPSINNGQGNVLKRMNKFEMNKLAKESGLLVPLSYKVELDKDKKIANIIEYMDIKYPCIVKPIQSIDGSKSDISINYNSNDLKKNLEKLSDSYNEVLVQEYIEKDGEIGITGFITSNEKKIIIPGIIDKRRQSTKALGSTTYAKIITEEESTFDLNQVKILLKNVGFVGIFDLELLLKDNKIYFVELNFRNGAYGYAFTKLGVNMPVLWCLDALGKDISSMPKKVNKTATFISEIADFRNVIERKVGLFEWALQFFTADAHLIMNKQDIKPFIFKLYYK
jgi:D-aspartate ligase